jgi:hypothetical protein
MLTEEDLANMHAHRTGSAMTDEEAAFQSACYRFSAALLTLKLAVGATTKVGRFDWSKNQEDNVLLAREASGRWEVASEVMREAVDNLMTDGADLMKSVRAMFRDY